MENKPNAVAQDVVVSLDYVLTVDGEIADTTAGRDPLPYIHGHNNLISGLEKLLEGMVVGESKSVVVPAVEAYGEVDPEAYSDMDRAKFPDNFEFKIGKTIRLNAGDGRILSAQICEIGDDVIKLDFNHPLAGKALNFDVTIADLREASEIELTYGRVNTGGCASCNGSCSSCG
ncbi:MAG: peptidylprolyl isomerase [Anaerolineae bacterium]|jgi:FKBP-type peptidyl-prolyl cis-trans isomerase SlyD|nr:peptidylprolyl isomerase [Anaerolineae bacterium]